MRKIVLMCLFAVQAVFVLAANLTPGNIVVVRVGDGSAALTNASTAVYLDEYTPAGALVQSIAAPTSLLGSNHALTLSGIATSEGALSLSADGQYLSLAGYDTIVGHTSISSGVTNRTIARVDASGVFNTTTGFLSGSAYIKDNIRAAVSNDGSEFWTAGNGNSSSGGTWYIPFGSFTSTPVHTNTTVNNDRVVNIFNSQLYFSTGSGASGIYTDGTGLPTTTGQVTALLPGLPTPDTLKSPYGFLMLDQNAAVAGVDVLYAVDDDTSAVLGGIYKYSLVGGVWVSNGRVQCSSAVRGITGYTVCAGTRLFLSGSTGIYTFLDSAGYNQTIRGTISQIVTAATNTAIRGLAFAPGTTAPTAPQLSIASFSNITCHGAGNGSITTSVTGGTAPLSYHWADGATSADRTNLSPGFYSLIVTDQYGCTSSVSETLTEPAALAITIDSITNLPCTGGNTGAVKITVTGGTGTYTYLWTPGNINTQNISGLSAGAYTVLVTDSAGCTKADSAIVSQSGSLTVSHTVTDVSCFGLADGAITLTVSGGTPGYTYQWSGSTNTSATITGLQQGSYTATVADNAGCSVTILVAITQPDSLSLSVVPVNVTTHGGTDGSVTLTVSGGTAGYTYLWSTASTASAISSLTAGPYCVTVADQHGCKDSTCVTLSEPTGALYPDWVNKFSAYASGSYLNIDFSATTELLMTAEVLDMSGHLVYQSISQHDTQLSLHIADGDIAAGCYVVRVVSDHGSVIRKIVIVK